MAGTSIGRSILLALLLTGLVPILVVGVLSIGVLNGNIQSQISTSLNVSAGARLDALLDHFESMKSRTQDFSSDGFIRDSLAGLEANPDANTTRTLDQYLLQNKLPLDPDLAGIIVTDLNGTILASTDPALLGRSESGNTFFTQGKQTVYLTPFRGQNIFGLNESYMASAPLTDRSSGKPLGVIINVFSTAETERILTSNSGSIGAGLGGNGTAPAQMPASYLVYKDMALFANPEASPNESGLVYSYTPTVRACLANSSGFSGRYVNYEGIDVYGVSVCLPDMGLTFISVIPSVDALAPLNEAVFYIGAICAFFAITIILSGLIISDSLTASIRKLTLVIDQISTGRLDAEIDPELKRSQDEIGELARAFDRTLVSLKLALKQTSPVLKAESDALKAALLEKENAEKAMREEGTAPRGTWRSQARP